MEIINWHAGSKVVERNLCIPDALGAIATSSAGAGMLTDIRGQLLASAEEGARLFVDVINGINADRDSKDWIPTLEPEEYRERAADWLTDNLTIAAAHLPVAEDRPRLLVPRLHHKITVEEIVQAWGAASDNGPWPWSDRMRFLGHWSADQLSGFDPESDPGETQFQVLPTAYDESHIGTALDQNRSVESLQIETPELHVAAIFDGALLGRRYKGQPRSWQDTHIRAINLEPAQYNGSDCVPRAHVYGDGDAIVQASDVRNSSAARLLAR
jgi:hypothetical protein